MSRVACLCVLLAAASAAAADLPPGALVRLGDDRFRAGSAVHHLALSPDGKQFATARDGGRGLTAVTVWDSATGRPVREQKVNAELFQGFVWGEGGAHAIALRADPPEKGKPAKFSPDDFRVWDFTDPKADAPPVLPNVYDGDPLKLELGKRREGVARYTDFTFSADGRRVAARWRSADDKHAAHVFELKSADSATKLKRVGTIDLGAEGADAVRLSADGKTLVTFRLLAYRGSPEEWTATVWDVAKGRPERPVRVPGGWSPPPILPDGGAVVTSSATETEWGYGLIYLHDGDRLELPRMPLPERERDPDTPRSILDEHQPADGVFLPPDNALIVPGYRTAVVDLKTGKLRGRFMGHLTAPTAVAASADGTRIATADRFGLIRLWDAKTLRPLNDAPGHRAPIRHAELSPDGKRLLTFSEDETLRLWDLATGTELRAVRGVYGRSDYIHPPRFTPDGTAVVYNGFERLVARDLQTGLEVPLPGELAKIREAWVAFAPDGKSVLTWTGGLELEVWDWPGGKKRFAVQTDVRAEEPGFTPDGTVFADVTHPARWSATTGKPLPGPWKDAVSVSQTFGLRDDLRPLVAQFKWTDPPRLLGPGTGAPLPGARLVEYEFKEADQLDLHPSWAVTFSPDRRQFALALSFFEIYEIRIYESATGKVRRTLPAPRPGGAYLLGFTPDGTRLLTTGYDHTVPVWDMRLQSVPLPEALKKETNAAKLWDTLATGGAKDAYLAMARLAREPETAVKMARLKLKLAAKGDRDTDATSLADARAIELLEALDTDDARALIKELAGGHADAFRTQEAKRAQERESARNKR